MTDADFLVIAALEAAIQRDRPNRVDGRVKPGHDDRGDYALRRK
jgi:hypothetical protein